MSELLSNAEDEKSAGRAGDGKNQQGIRYEAFFRFWPIAFIKHVQKQAGRHKVRKEERAYYAIASWRGLSAIAKLVLIEIAILVPLALLYSAGVKDAANWVIAAFTIVMALTTGLQWSAMKQGMEQTKYSLELSRLQLRPDIVITNVTSAALQPFHGMQLQFTIENHGNSVATVYACQIIPVFGGYLPTRIQRDAMIKYGWREEGRRDLQAQIPPRCPFTSCFNAIQPIENENELTYDRVSEIVKGQLRLYFVVAIFFDSAISRGDTYVCTCRHDEHLGVVSVSVLCSEAIPGERRSN